MYVNALVSPWCTVWHVHQSCSVSVPRALKFGDSKRLPYTTILAAFKLMSCKFWVPHKNGDYVFMHAMLHGWICHCQLNICMGLLNAFHHQWNLSKLHTDIALGNMVSIGQKHSKSWQYFRFMNFSLILWNRVQSKLTFKMLGKLYMTLLSTLYKYANMGINFGQSSFKLPLAVSFKTIILIIIKFIVIR